jgi:hypothetical protein
LRSLSTFSNKRSTSPCMRTTSMGLIIWHGSLTCCLYSCPKCSPRRYFEVTLQFRADSIRFW